MQMVCRHQESSTTTANSFRSLTDHRINEVCAAKKAVVEYKCIRGKHTCDVLSEGIEQIHLASDGR